MAGLFGEEGDRLERLALLPHPRGMLASEGRGSVMSPGIDWTDWIAPEWLASLVGTGGRIATGDMDERDALNVALGMMGGGGMLGRGSGVGMNVFHAGPRKITQVDPTKLQSRDPGFYGKGFYVSELPQYGYGNVVSKFDLPDELIFKARRSPEFDEATAKKVAAWYYDKRKAAAEARGKLDDLAWERDQILKKPIDYIKAVNDYATDHGYKAISFGSSEVVVKDPSVLKPLPFKKKEDTKVSAGGFKLPQLYFK